MRLQRIAKPFDNPDCIFELKHDGFRDAVGFNRCDGKQPLHRVNKAIPDRCDPAVPEVSSPNAEWSKVDYGVHVVGVRIQDQQPNRRIHLDENRQFYEGSRPLLLAWVSY
jgi:hypothetical protein